MTNGYGPETFAIQGSPTAHPYTLIVHDDDRGPMGYGMGKVDVLTHDGAGKVVIEPRPLVVMVENAYVNLGTY